MNDHNKPPFINLCYISGVIKIIFHKIKKLYIIKQVPFIFILLDHLDQYYKYEITSLLHSSITPVNAYLVALYILVIALSFSTCPAILLMKITLDPFDHSYSDFVVFNGLKPTYKNKQLLCAKGHTFFVTLATFFLTFLLIIPPNKKNNNKGYFRTFERIFVKKEGF